MRKTADAVTQCKFESTDPASDDTVLYKILQASLLHQKALARQVRETVKEQNVMRGQSLCFTDPLDQFFSSETLSWSVHIGERQCSDIWGFLLFSAGAAVVSKVSWRQAADRHEPHRYLPGLLQDRPLYRQCTERDHR